MRRATSFAIAITFTITFTSASASTNAWAGEKSGAGAVKAPITRVTVFADRAEAVRSAAASCKGGKAALVFPLLPAGIDERTLRARASGKATAVGTSSRTVELEQPLDPRVAALADELEKIERKTRELLERAQGLSERYSGAGSFGDYLRERVAEGVLAREPDTARWSESLDLIRGERLEAARRQTKLEAEVRELDRQRAVLARKLESIDPTGSRKALEVTVAVECHGEKRPEVALSYVVPGATWYPEYELDFAPSAKGRVGDGEVAITVSALVRQTTGEDWSDVELVLSTAEPRLGAEAPRPARITLSGHDRGKEKVLLEVAEDRKRLPQKAAEINLPLAAAAPSPAGPAIEDRGRSFNLVLGRKVTVRSDGRPYWMPVDVVKAGARSALVTVPAEMPYVYQVARLDNPARYPLVAGRVHVHRSGSHVGTTRIEHTAIGEPMEISLGIDGELWVERKDTRRKDRDPGAFSSTRKLERAYRIKLISHARDSAPIEVREAIPVSKVEDVEVVLHRKKTTRGYEHDRTRGLLTWKITVPAGKEQAIDLAYTVKIPDDWSLSLR